MDYENDSLLFSNGFLDHLDPNSLFQGKENFLGDDYQRELFQMQNYEPTNVNINGIFCDNPSESFSLMGAGSYVTNGQIVDGQVFDMLTDNKENEAIILESNNDFEIDKALCHNIGMENIAHIPPSNEAIPFDKPAYHDIRMEDYLSQSPNTTFPNFAFNNFNPELDDLLERSVKNNFENVRHTHDDHIQAHLPNAFTNESFGNYDLLTKPEIADSCHQYNNVESNFDENEIDDVDMDLVPSLSDLPYQKSVRNQYINCSRIKYVKEQSHIGNTKSHTVQFTTYPAAKKTSRKNLFKVENLAPSPQKRSDYSRTATTQNIPPENTPSNVVLPVGASGFQVSIPSSAHINFDSFSPLNYNYHREDIYNPDGNNFQMTNFNSSNRVTIKVCTGFQRNKNVVDNQLLKLTKKMVLQSTDVDNRASENLGTLEFDDSPANTYPATVQRKICKIVSFLKREVSPLTDDILDRLSIPIATVKRGYLKTKEIICLKEQINYLNLLEEKRQHKKCLIFNCRTCKDVQQWRAELHELQKWRDTTGPKSCLLSLPSHVEWKNINNSTILLDTDAGDKKPLPIPSSITVPNRKLIRTVKEFTLPATASKHSAVFIQDNEVFPINTSTVVNNGSMFHVQQLDIGNVSILADDDHNPIKLHFIDKSLLYEIELQIESSEQSWQDVKVLYINIEVPFTSVCHLQSPKELEIELLVRETPSLVITKKIPVRTVISSEESLPLSTLQASLITSIRLQLVRSPFHKLQVTKSNFDTAKCCFINSCDWLDSPFVNNAERSLSETPKDWVINEFSLDRKNVKAEISKKKQRKGKIGRPIKKISARTKRKRLTKTKSKSSLKSIVLINIFSSDPLTNPNQENANSDDLVWVAEQSTLKASGWSKS